MQLVHENVIDAGLKQEEFCIVKAVFVTGKHLSGKESAKIAV